MKSTLAHRSVIGGILVVLILSVLFIITGPPLPVAGQGPVGPIVGKPWRGAPGITETVAQIMEREKNAPPLAPGSARAVPRRPDHRTLRRQQNSSAPPTAQVGTPQGPLPIRLPSSPTSPQTVGTNFLGVQWSESGYIPPDSMGGVGPTQILVHVNGRIKVFDKAGNLALSVDTNTFWNSVRNGQIVGDPQVSYDRLTGRWFLSTLNFPASGPNRILIAVSSSSTITNTSSFTFFQFQHDLVGTTSNADTDKFADYDTLGVDKNSLYIGVNVFNGTIFTGSTGFVVNKSDLLSGTLTVTAFRQLVNCSSGCGSGPFAPQGVDNDDPSATEGYFIGVDYVCCSLLTLRRVTYSGITPTISSNIFITVPTTRFPIDVPALGSSPAIDAIDDRLFAAAVHKNKITGVNSLWTAHNIEVNSSGVGTVGGGRDGARWYELGNLTTTPTLQQSGTLFDSAASNPRFFWIPSVAMSGQGHMALGSSTARSTDYAGIAIAGRFSSDPVGTIQPFMLAQAGLGSYTLVFSGINRWGDYSQTVVDPNDDMTMWTFQEYANATNSWAVRVIKLIAPPPAMISDACPSGVPPGQASVNVLIRGTSVLGSGFFDPGSDVGGPTFTNHITAAVTGGVTVNSIGFLDPTHVTLDISTVSASMGAQSVTVTNPDGQIVTGSGVLTITSASIPCHSYFFPIILK